ncbi:MAB_1171c family putative transporter [Lentzea sp. BCCO 10_0856]|uniref:MAB_1171c family putative transporter n=1 Tax=Lentzea miocenica TaxID=3095431 RepID=A0ABU4SYT7_9PSEU|nr:MAB_1171c family putative transporter [Lentzea sp. BCCO 10_0856]MDX8031083.1 MAB_1171c family putative transporter [Lentzea sp. BCCO 10_0856]
MAIFNLIYLSCGIVGLLLLAYKIRALRSSWGSPRVVALISTVFFAAFAVLFAAPANITWINWASGVPNFAALLVYSLVVCFAGAAFALVLYWRYPPVQAWQRVRLIVVSYTSIVAAMIVLFFKSEVGEERQVDFDTFYATQPTVAVFLFIYLVATAVGCGGQAYHCWQGSRDEAISARPWLARGLRWYCATALFPVAFAVIKLFVLLMDWFGERSFDILSLAAPLMASLSMIPLVIAMALPVFGPRRPSPSLWVRRWRTYFALRPLHRALVHVNPGIVLVAPGKFLNPHHRVRRQIIELNDWRWALTPYFDLSVGETATSLAREASLPKDEVAAVVEAAQLRAAGSSSGRLRPAKRRPASEIVDGTDLSVEHDRWVRISRAYQHSPIVDAAVADVTRVQAAGGMD